MQTTCPTCQQPAAPGAPCVACGMSVPEILAEAVPMMAPHSLPKGTRLRDGAYAIGEVLGQGGFGITYKGGDMALKRYVAIKEYFPLGAARHGTRILPSGHTTLQQFQQQRESFVSEARILAQFSHPGIVRVFGVFEENDTAYIVMEMLEGRTLQQVLDEKGKLNEEEVLDIARQVGSALEVVHAAGMLHRDIKPDNILLLERPDELPRAVLIDFGTARAFNVEQTRAMTAQLTPAYAPLEQYAQQAHFGAYTDIYALAGTCYHALTGKLPPSAMDRLSGVELVPPNQLRTGLNPATSQAIMAGLEVKAPARPQNVKEFLANFDRSMANVPPAGNTVMAQPPSWGAPTPSWPAGPVPGQYNGVPEPAPAKFPVGLIGVGLALLATAFVAFFSGRPVSTPDPTGASAGAASNNFIPPPRQSFFPPPMNLPPPSANEIYDAAFARLSAALPSPWDYNIQSFQEAGIGADGSWRDPAGPESSPNTYWAGGSFKYTGPPVDLQFGSNTIHMEGNAEPAGYTTVVWTMHLTRSSRSNLLRAVSLDMR